MNSQTVSRSPVLLAATEALAENLAQSQPFMTYRLAQARLEADLAARELLQRFAAAQADLRTRQAQGAAASAEMQALRDLQREVQASPVIVDYADSQQGATAYLREINQELNQLLGVDFGALSRRSCC